MPKRTNKKNRSLNLTCLFKNSNGRANIQEEFGKFEEQGERIVVQYITM